MYRDGEDEETCLAKILREDGRWSNLDKSANNKVCFLYLKHEDLFRE